jgi:hypothetical protein
MVEVDAADIAAAAVSAPDLHLAVAPLAVLVREVGIRQICGDMRLELGEDEKGVEQNVQNHVRNRQNNPLQPRECRE